jgi:hypothetical protein
MANKAFEPVGSTIVFSQSSASGAAALPADMDKMVAQVTDISMNVETTDIDVSHFLSSGYKESIGAALKEPGELSCTVHFDPTVDISSILGVTVHVVITFKDGYGNTEGSWSFDGYVKTYSFTGAIGSAMTASLSIKAAGRITVA